MGTVSERLGFWHRVPTAFSDREVEAGTVAARARGRRDLGSMAPEAFIDRIKKEIAEKSLP